MQVGVPCSKCLTLGYDELTAKIDVGEIEAEMFGEGLLRRTFGDDPRAHDEPEPTARELAQAWFDTLYEIGVYA